MKIGLLFIAALMAVVASEVYNGDGQPQKCPSADNSLHRNAWDPTHYWICSKAGQPAERKQCPQSDPAFLPDVNKCGSWEKWQWIAPTPPKF